MLHKGIELSEEDTKKQHPLGVLDLNNFYRYGYKEKTIKDGCLFWVKEVQDKTVYEQDYEPDAERSYNETYIKFGNCRICGGKVTPYSDKYYMKEFNQGYWYNRLYAADNYYCQACAKERCSYIWQDLCNTDFHIVSRKELHWTDWLAGEVVYSDGSKLEWDSESKADARRLHNQLAQRNY